jgi:hypothetical protein
MTSVLGRSLTGSGVRRIISCTGHERWPPAGGDRHAATASVRGTGALLCLFGLGGDGPLALARGTEWQFQPAEPFMSARQDSLGGEDQ